MARVYRHAQCEWCTVLASRDAMTLDASPMNPPSRRVALLVLASIAMHAGFMLVRAPVAAQALAWSAAAVALLSALMREPQALHATLLFALIMGWAGLPHPLLVWPLYLLAPLIAYAFSVRMVRPLRRTATWWKRGRIDRVVLAMMLGAAVVSSLALALWLKWLHPDLGDLRDQIPDVSTAALVGIGLVFSVGNALLEEFIWRGVLMESLDAGFGVGVASVIVQAVSFGIAHIAGFPRGALGMAMAAVYGLMLGAIRRRSGGLLAPVITHVFADVTIFALLMRAVR